MSCVLVVGGGGREHALAWALSHSPSVDRLLVAPGNPGTAALNRTENAAVAADDVAGLVALCRRESVDLAVIGPEDPLAAGIVDALASAGVAAFGPSAACARLEASKAYCKRFLIDNGIPTAAAEVFEDPDAALAHLASRPDVPVVKASGLAAGKGVIGMKILGEGVLRDRVGEALQHALALDCIDCFTIGAEDRYELADLVQRIPEASTLGWHA